MPAQKHPITPDILLRISKLSPHSSFDASFWAISLVSFFGMLQERHLWASSAHSFDPFKQLLCSDFPFFCQGAPVTIPWSKIILFWEKVVQIPLMGLIPGSPLFPVTASQWASSFITLPSPPFLLGFHMARPYFPHAAHWGHPHFHCFANQGLCQSLL